MDDGAGFREREDEASAKFRGFLGRASDRCVEWRDNEEFATLEFRLPVAGKLERIKPPRGTDDERLWSAQKEAQAFLLDGCAG